VDERGLRARARSCRGPARETLEVHEVLDVRSKNLDPFLRDGSRLVVLVLEKLSNFLERLSFFFEDREGAVGSGEDGRGGD
jgi:hypothetical protein